MGTFLGFVTPPSAGLDMETETLDSSSFCSDDTVDTKKEEESINTSNCCLIVDDGSGSPAILCLPIHMRNNPRLIASCSPGLLVECVVHVKGDKKQGYHQFWIDSMTVWTVQTRDARSDPSKAASMQEPCDLDHLFLRGLEIQYNHKRQMLPSDQVDGKAPTVHDSHSPFYPKMFPCNNGSEDGIRQQIYEFTQSCAFTGGVTRQDLATVLDLDQSLLETDSNSRSERNGLGEEFISLEHHLQELQRLGKIHLDDQGNYKPIK